MIPEIPKSCTVADVQRVLGLLGTSHREVADTLLAKGIRGEHLTHACPITMYIREQFPEIPGVWTDNLLLGNEDSIITELPFPVRAFVTHFDGGEYPELERESA